MSVTSTIKKVSVSVKLDVGTTTTGKTKLASLNLGTLSKTGFDADKVMVIVNLLGACLNKTVYAVEKNEVSTLTAA